jgi:hypothetical protein
MSNKNDRSVFRRPDGTWVNKLNDVDRASSLHNTQSDAEAAARKMLRNSGPDDGTAIVPSKIHIHT